jgi:lipopolysaccharide export system permease protein
MTIMDRYLLRQFLQTFLICFISMVGLFVVFHAFTNLEGFLRYADKNGGLLRIMATYYGCHTFFFFDRFVGLLTLTSAMFTMTWIQRHNEMTALMAAGVSRVRVVAPVIGAVAAILILAVFNRELIIPRFRNELSKKPQELAGDRGREVTPQYDDVTGILIRGSLAFLAQQRLEKPSIWLPPVFDGYAKQISAKNAIFQPADSTRPAGLLMQQVECPKDLHLQPSLMFDGAPVVITPRDAPEWLEKNECFIVTNTGLEQLVNAQTWLEFASTPQLIRGLRNRSVDFGGDIRVTIHTRFVQPLLDMTLLFLGLPLVVTRGSRNVFIAMGVCGVVVTAFTLIVLAFQQLGANMAINPVLAVWAPLMLFVPAAVETTYSLTK